MSTSSRKATEVSLKSPPAIIRELEKTDKLDIKSTETPHSRNFVFKHPLTCMVSGPTFCGKTYFVNQLLQSDKILPTLQRMIWLTKDSSRYTTSYKEPCIPGKNSRTTHNEISTAYNKRSIAYNEISTVYKQTSHHKTVKAFHRFSIYIGIYDNARYPTQFGYTFSIEC